MLTLDPKSRPSVDELLKNPLILPKIKEFHLQKYLKMSTIHELLKTIAVPDDLTSLKSKLPTQKYYRIHSSL